MNPLAKLAIWIGAGAALASCQSDDERAKAQRDTIMASCRDQTRASPTLRDVDAEGFCICLADGLMAAGNDSRTLDTAAVGDRCRARAHAVDRAGGP